MTSDLKEYLATAFERTFVLGEYDENVQQLYKLLGGAVRLEADRVLLNETAFVALKQGEAVVTRRGMFPIETERGTVIYRARYPSAMATILRHDPVVREHFRLVEESPERIVYAVETGSTES